MSQKAELPSLTGHRTKTRKRDEKQVNNPTGFRDSVIEGLQKTGQSGADLTDNEVGIDIDNWVTSLLNIVLILGRS